MTLDLPPDFFTQCLSPTDASTLVRFQYLLARASRTQHVEALSHLDVEKYAELGKCERHLVHSPKPVPVTAWGGPEDDQLGTSHDDASVWRVTWQGETLFVVQAKWRVGWDTTARVWVIANTREIAQAFALDVARQTNDPGDAILVFHGSCWQRSHELWRATQQASFDDLVLAGALKAQIRADFRHFLGARAAYESVGLAWRRGALFLGPPGNGKTHCLRALVKELAVPSLYVQSIKHRYETDEANLKSVFERARQLRPCVLVFEDLDALVTNENRSFFLNQLDGFEKNVGMIVLATTNHPERVDPAILDRPSRFDRKYHFDLPAAPERRTYLAQWQRRLAKPTGWSEDVTAELADQTAGFSFAYLKELVVSALLRSVSGDGPFAKLLEEARVQLAAQMATALTRAVPDVVADLDDDDHDD